MEKLTEHTYGPHTYMKLEIRAHVCEIDVYWRESGTTYTTSASDCPGYPSLQEIIEAFNALF